MLYFCRRGREGQRDLRADNFHLNTDDNGNKYVIQVGSEVTKNHQSDDDGVSGGIMYVNSANPLHCPVRAFELYITKMNPICDALFQRPRDKYSVDDLAWYENKPLGKNTLSAMMSTISRAANLSQRYTNHSIRATSITLLSEAGFNNRHIMSVSRHRNEGSISSYVKDTSIQQKQQMAEALATATMATAIFDQSSSSGTSSSQLTSHNSTGGNNQSPINTTIRAASSNQQTSIRVPLSPVISQAPAQEQQLECNKKGPQSPRINIDMPRSAAASLFSNATITGGHFNIFLGQKQ